MLRCVVRIAILGAGAIGSLIGAALAERHDVTLVGRKPHMEAVARLGLQAPGFRTAPVRLAALTSPAALTMAPDLVVITVKAHATGAAAAELAATGYRGPVLSLQNGLRNLSELAGALPGPVLAGVTTIGVTYVGPGEVRLTGRGETLLGAPGGGHADLLHRLADDLSEGGLSCSVSGDIDQEIWGKGIVNAGINPLTAITGLPNGALVEEGRLAQTMALAVVEATIVARALGHPFEEEKMVERTRDVARLTAANRSSMLQDIERGRRTEVDSITGVFVREGEARSIPVPVNATLLGLVHGIERTTASR